MVIKNDIVTTPPFTYLKVHYQYLLFELKE